ncbi:MAG: hypothetical protein RQ982_00320 [Gammaproteobacteria bacterium]|nr:hypothetical protein [Gammaproteobacteria bacterium]
MHSVINASLLKQAGKIPQGSVELKNLLAQLSRSADDNAIDRVIALYKKTIVKLEQKIWADEPGIENIENYQNAFKVLEKLYELRSVDTRYSFKIVIPVADRPQHLKQCLQSLSVLCESYGYGGTHQNRFNKISVLIADDSKQGKNIRLHQDYCNELISRGIETEYFGLAEQLALTRKISAEQKDLSHIISSVERITTAAEFSHKGASIMRNITYLKLQQSLSETAYDKNTLLYFIDSDQEFCINSTGSDNNLYAINYFHYLNEIFSTQDISILTGKVVGDPPVSPSVMAGNFQKDVKNFVTKIKKLRPENPCQFHQHEINKKDDSAYHDMANLFGFSHHKKAFNYHCSLYGQHDNADCFYDFSKKMGSFFYGEHPTRKTFFSYADGFDRTIPARTVYTGNYVIKPEALSHFIPFAPLKLRMAGPVLGRILKARLKHRFVSANLPMLHNRTVDSTGQSEFRAGVDSHNNLVDLSNEFIRQFYGDVALFSIQKIAIEKFPDTTLSSEALQSILDATYDEIKHSYIEKHNIIMQLKRQIQKQLNDDQTWWNMNADDNNKIKQALSNINNFLENIQLNFDEKTPAYKTITSQQASQVYLASIHRSILSYQTDMDLWKTALAVK